MKLHKQISAYPVVALRGIVGLPGARIYFDADRAITTSAVTKALEEEQLVFAVALRDSELDNPGPEDFYEVGVIAKIEQVTRLSGQVLRVTMNGLCRGVMEDIYKEEDILMAKVKKVERDENVEDSGEQTQSVARFRALRDIFRQYAHVSGRLSSAVIKQIMSITDLETLIDQIACQVPIGLEGRQMILGELDVESRYYKLCLLLNRDMEILRIQNHIMEEVKVGVSQNQKEYYLREQLKAIHQELGEGDTETEIDRYRRKLQKLSAPKKVKKQIQHEIGRLAMMNSSSSESGVIRGYIETLLSLPWKKAGKDNEDLAHAAKVLDEDHYGMDKIKERVVDYLAVRARTEKGNSPILCLAGPPGTGKTSIAKSVARALGKPYVRICLGGVRDEAEIRGHRRTYVGAMAGRIIKAVQEAKVKNPLILFDEIDKLGNDYKGDPASALLEVLDPEQNRHFTDHYVELPFDLSEAMFICTANDVEDIPKPLLDRMELIEVPGYTANEKYHIAREHLLPKQLKLHGLSKADLKISDKAIKTMISGYTREAGVRGLERKIATVCRKATREILEKEAEKISVTHRNLKDYLGKIIYTPDKKNNRDEVGLVRGLAWTSAGGVTLEIEVAVMPGSGNMELTGQMGDVMKESARIAFSYVRSLSKQYHIEEDYFEKHDFHLHIPEGATPKDGPSAGITMTVAFLSAVTEKKVKADLAMTGEVTLRGRVLAIGGLKEKLLAAKEAGITQVIIPKENVRDLEEMSQEITEGMEIIPVEQMSEVIRHALV